MASRDVLPLTKGTGSQILNGPSPSTRARARERQAHYDQSRKEDRQAPEVGRKSQGSPWRRQFCKNGRILPCGEEDRHFRRKEQQVQRCRGWTKWGLYRPMEWLQVPILRTRVRIQSEAKQEPGNSFPRSPSRAEMPPFLKGQEPKGLPDTKQEDLQIQQQL